MGWIWLDFGSRHAKEDFLGHIKGTVLHIRLQFLLLGNFTKKSPFLPERKTFHSFHKAV